MSDEGVEQAVHQIEDLISALDSVPDPAAREPARALLEVVLDLHAVALARMAATIAASADGPALLQRLAEDEATRGILLLHGLHPETVEVRVGKALEALRPQFSAYGLGLRLVECSAKLARVRVPWIGTQPEPIDAAALQDTLQAAIIEAAPDLEMLEIEGLDATVAAMVG
jgi:hypothetical protein